MNVGTPKFENKLVMKLYYISFIIGCVAVLGVYLGMEVLDSMIITIIFTVIGAICTLIFLGISAVWEIVFKAKYWGIN